MRMNERMRIETSRDTDASMVGDQHDYIDGEKQAKVMTIHPQYTQDKVMSPGERKSHGTLMTLEALRRGCPVGVLAHVSRSHCHGW